MRWLAYFRKRMPKIPQFMLDAKERNKPVTLPSLLPPETDEPLPW
jgi:hypothetical protein